jgi:hypothetical protein
MLITNNTDYFASQYFSQANKASSGSNADNFYDFEFTDTLTIPTPASPSVNILSNGIYDWKFFF